MSAFKTIGHTSSGKPIYAAYQGHRNFDGWTAVDHWDASEAHEAAKRTASPGLVTMHTQSAALHDADAKRLVDAVKRLGLVGSAKTSKRHHATKKPEAQLDREIASRVGKQIDRKKLAELMTPWDEGPVYAVSSYYYSGKKYPDRAVVERAIAKIEGDIPRAMRGESGWTKADARDLQTIAQGLRYYLHLDYK